MKTFIIIFCLFAGSLFAQEIKTLSVAGSTTTGNHNLGNQELLAIHDVDGDFAGTTITLYASTSATGNFAPVVYDGVTQTFTVTAGFYYAPNPSATANIMFLKIVSDASETMDYGLVVGNVIGN